MLARVINFLKKVTPNKQKYTYELKDHDANRQVSKPPSTPLATLAPHFVCEGEGGGKFRQGCRFGRSLEVGDTWHNERCGHHERLASGVS